jgi:fumarate hydratase class I
MPDFAFQPLFELGPDETEYRKLTSDGVSTVELQGRTLLKVEPEALTRLARDAMDDVSHLLRSSHLEQVSNILKDPEASENDRFVALQMLKNANISAGHVLPFCQDTGTAIAMGHKGENVFTGGDDAEALSKGIFQAYQEKNLRYSQLAPLDMYTEKNTGTNLPAQIDIYSDPGDEYHLLFMAKGGGSANKTFLYQETKALLNPESLLRFIAEKIRTLGTAACPPYHLALVIGGTSAELTLKTVKLASARYLDALPVSGNEGGRAFRDLELEGQVQKLCNETGIGAQFGGKYFALDVRVIRLPRHGASCPVGIGVSCSADRQILGKITREGVFLEQLETNPEKYLPEVSSQDLGGEVVEIDLTRPMPEILAELGKHPVATRLSLSGPLVVGRDIAHAKLKERLDAGDGLPQYIKDHAIYYAGPAKTPEGYASGSFGPTTAGRMDSYVDLFQSHGGSMVMLAKGNRSPQVREACKKHGGFEVEDFPAFIVVDDKGNDFYADLIDKPAPRIKIGG